MDAATVITQAIMVKDTKAPRKLTLREQLAEAQFALAQQNTAFSLLEVQNKALQKEVERLERERDTRKLTEANASDALARFRMQANQVHRWAQQYHPKNHVVQHAIQAVLFTPGYGEVHPFARWGYPGLGMFG